MIEEWKPIKDYEGWYEISNLGNVRSVDRYVSFVDGRHANYLGQTIKQTRHSHGYWVVNLLKNKKQNTKYVHRLIAEAFIPNPENKKVVNHKDRDKSNNEISNLEWCTQAENLRHARVTELPSVLKSYTPNKQEDVKIEEHHPKYMGHIHQYDLSGNYIDSYDSCRQAAKVIGGSASSISSVTSGKRKTHKGFIWKKNT